MVFFCCTNCLSHYFIKQYWFEHNNIIHTTIFGSCGSLTSLACISGTGASLSLNTATSPGGAGLTIGAIYYVRIYSPSTSPAGSNWTYNICVTDPPPPPANDACSGAVTLTPGAAGAACSSTGGTLASATVSSPSVSSNCIGSPGADVWYTFTATSPFNTIALNTIQSSIQASTAYLEVYSGTCGSLTSIYCVSGTGTTLNMLPGGTGLTVGNTYYVESDIRAPQIRQVVTGTLIFVLQRRARDHQQQLIIVKAM